MILKYSIRNSLANHNRFTENNIDNMKRIVKGLPLE